MDKQQEQSYLKTLNGLVRIINTLAIAILVLVVLLFFHRDIQAYIDNAPKRSAEKFALQQQKLEEKKAIEKIAEKLSFWQAVPIETEADTTKAKQLAYGKDLIAHTAKYLGPKGSVAQITNGLNCQNCHLEAGTKAWGNNYGSVFANYPKYRARSATKENILKRINDCMERSLNGTALDTNSKEILAIKAYIEHIGSNVEKGKKATASGIYKLAFLNRACNPENGKALYATKCASCHQPDGQGLLADNKIEYTYPPLWGKNSYNAGAGLYRLSRFAGYIKYNMPQGATYQEPQLTDEEAWDIAAFVNSQARPLKDLSNDWPNIAEKPTDHPFGPYADTFSVAQHKFGPYKRIADFNKINNPKK